MSLRFALLASALAFAAPAFADHRKEVPMQESLDLLSFGDDFKQCLEWTDGCAVCKRTDAVRCSTPGALCKPEIIGCTTP